jgi:zinc protease
VGETRARAFERLEAFVAETLEPKLRPAELVSTRQQLGPFLGTAELPDSMLAKNPYVVAFSLGRREQLGMDPRAIKRAFETVTDVELQRARKEIFAPSRHTAAFISVEK